MEKRTRRNLFVLLLVLSFLAWMPATLIAADNKAVLDDCIDQVNACYLSKDMKGAVKWLKKCSKLGDSESQVELADSYEKGLGVKKNLKEAVKWYKKAAAQGESKAKEALKRLNQ